MNTLQYIRKCDADFRERLQDVADAVARSFDSGRSIRLISLSGPTCSGKTTAAAMIADRLEEHGKRVHVISIDDFYYDRDYLHEISRKKGLDVIDYDSEETIDLASLDAFVEEALSGESAHCPTFDFKTGNRRGYRAVESGENDVFIFEGIQAIYPSVTALFEPYGFIGVYIAPLTPLCVGDKVFLPDDIRLMRRIVRDAHFRNTDADFTLSLWKSVRANEERSIFPYVNNCAYRIDSTHSYELGVLKPYLEEYLRDIGESSENFSTAREILSRVEKIEPIDSSLIDDRSLYREFV